MPTETPAIPTSSCRDAPWTAGLRAARANVIPGLIVQAAMLAVGLAYYFYPPSRIWLDVLAEWKAHWGYLYSAVAALVAGAFIPELLRIAVFQKGRVQRRNFSNLLFTAPFWGLMGMMVDLFYRTQGVWFGLEPTFSVVTKKVLVDQLLYNPLFAAPVTVWLYEWKQRGYRLGIIRRFFTVAHYRDAVVPVIFATWGVWIPVVAILYSLPSLLQIPIWALALSLWVTLYTWMSETRVKETP